jgi:phosphoribosyl-ATP pyrophosphohydrolase
MPRWQLKSPPDLTVGALNGLYDKKIKDNAMVDRLTTNIRRWHAERKITVNGNPLTQTIKLGEEYGELCSAMIRNDGKAIVDSLGDMYVVMVAIADLKGFCIEDCIKAAYDEIKNRKGYLNEHGNFIKEEDSDKDQA